VVNYKPTDYPILRDARARIFGENPPASTLIGVQALALEDLLIEIEAIAAVQ
jgi:enamine deaminase RidA (YjgF/YER057c/UK114 family)